MSGEFYNIQNTKLSTCGASEGSYNWKVGVTLLDGQRGQGRGARIVPGRGPGGSALIKCPS